MGPAWARGTAPQQNLWGCFFSTKRDRKSEVKSCSSWVWAWSWRFWSALGAHSHWRCHMSPRDQGWLVPLCPKWGQDPCAQNSPVQAAGDFQSRDTHPPLPPNPGEPKGCVLCGSGNAGNASSGLQEPPQRTLPWESGVPRAHRHCTDTPSHHKMKEFVFILFFQVRDNYVFFQK